MSKPGVNLVKWFPPVDDKPTPEQTALHIRALYTGTNDHDQAITLLKQQLTTVGATATAAATVAASTNTSRTITITEIAGFGNLAAVNNQTGQTSYTLQGTDNGSLVVLNDASPIAVTLNSVVMAPYFVFIANQGTGTATLSASSGSINGTTTVSGGSSVIVFYDGTNWWVWAVSSGITQLTGDVTAGPGSGSQAATVVATHLTAPLPVAQGGSGTATPSIVAGTGVTVTGSWPNQTVNSSGVGGVSSLNSLTGALSIVAGANVTVTPSGSSITVASSGVAGGFSPYPSSLTIPLSANFSWLNPNSYLVTNTDKTDRLLLLVPASSLGAAFMQTAALPSTPYTIDVGFVMPTIGAIILASIALKNSSGAAIRSYGLRTDSAVATWKLSDQSWLSVTSPDSEVNATGAEFIPAQLFFIRITDDGTNRNTYWSTNGKDYELWISQASGTGVTPNRAGIIFYNSGTSVLQVSVYHWLISNSILPQYAS